MHTDLSVHDLDSNSQLQKSSRVTSVVTAEIGTDTDSAGFCSDPTDVRTPFGLNLSAAQILALADGMKIEDTDWMNLIISEPGFSL